MYFSPTLINRKLLSLHITQKFKNSLNFQKGLFYDKFPVSNNMDSDTSNANVTWPHHEMAIRDRDRLILAPNYATLLTRCVEAGKLVVLRWTTQVRCLPDRWRVIQWSVCVTHTGHTYMVQAISVNSSPWESLCVRTYLGRPKGTIVVIVLAFRLDNKKKFLLYFSVDLHTQVYSKVKVTCLPYSDYHRT